MAIPKALLGKKYISLITYRRTGVAVPTPVWFGEDGDTLYVMTRSDSGKYKRLRNNPQVHVAPCTIRGKINGPEFTALARILPAQDGEQAKAFIHKKYWLSRLPIWNKSNVFISIENIAPTAGEQPGARL